MDGGTDSGLPLSIRLPHKPTAALSCTLTPGTTTQNLFVVFLNGLGLPQSAWSPAVSRYLALTTSHPPLLTYDRYGQGSTTTPDPQDDDPNPHPPGQRHDLASVVRDLRSLIAVVTPTAFPGRTDSSSPPRIIFVANSIGCPVARYYAQTYDGVAALLLLDSYMTDTEFVSLYPDPDAAEFDERSLPDGITVPDIRAAREGMGRLFHPSVVNSEGFWRGNITSLLPHPHSPRLYLENGGGERGPWVTVVGHDWDVFAVESTRMPGMTSAVANAYTNPAWARYNDGLLRITSADRAKGMRAPRAGHFIQRDRPDLVAQELARLVALVAG